METGEGLVVPPVTEKVSNQSAEKSGNGDVEDSETGSLTNVVPVTTANVSAFAAAASSAPDSIYMSPTLYVGDLHPDLTDENLRTIF